MGIGGMMRRGDNRDEEIERRLLSLEERTLQTIDFIAKAQFAVDKALEHIRLMECNELKSPCECRYCVRVFSPLLPTSTPGVKVSEPIYFESATALARACALQYKPPDIP
jgi:hypothetical protein